MSRTAVLCLFAVVAASVFGALSACQRPAAPVVKAAAASPVAAAAPADPAPAPRGAADDRPASLMHEAFADWDGEHPVVTDMPGHEGAPAAGRLAVTVTPELVVAVDATHRVLVVTGSTPDEHDQPSTDQPEPGNLGAHWFVRRHGRWFESGRVASILQAGTSGDVGIVKAADLGAGHRALAPRAAPRAGPGRRRRDLHRQDGVEGRRHRRRVVARRRPDAGAARCGRRLQAAQRQRSDAGAVMAEPVPAVDDDFARDGFAIVPSVLGDEALAAIEAALQRRQRDPVGTRTLLAEAWCAALADTLRADPRIAALLPAAHVAVQCTWFEKSVDRNWLVPIHQDVSIPVARRVDDPALTGWSRKEGAWYAQPPTALLERLVALRVHLDDCTLRDGPLQVVAGSHRRGRIAAQAAIEARRATPALACPVDRGGAMLMRPLLLHASGKSHGTGRRRVLHFLFGPRELPSGLRWPELASPD